MKTSSIDIEIEPLKTGMMLSAKAKVASKRILKEKGSSMKK